MDKKKVVAASHAVKHPPPWRWAVTRDYRDAEVLWRLEDSTGTEVVAKGFCGADIQVASPVVRELIRLAPEMEAMLRSIEWCPSCSGRNRTSPDGTSFHFSECKLAAILSAIDAARKDAP